MKKRRMLSAALAILMAVSMLFGFAGCGSKDNSSETGGGTGEKDAAESVFPFETGKLTPGLAAEYWKILNEKINKHGILDTAAPEGEKEGVQGGFLLDMDDNGIPELVICSFYHVAEEYGYNCPRIEVYYGLGGDTSYLAFDTDLYGTTAGYETKYFLEQSGESVHLNRYEYQEVTEPAYESFDEGQFHEGMFYMHHPGASFEELEALGVVINPDKAAKDDKIQQLVKNSSGEYTFGFENNAQQLLSALASRAPLNAETFLENICYYGDRSECAMTKEMAEAYAEVIEGLPKTVSNDWETGDLHVMLADPNNDGMPILMASYIYNSEYDDCDCGSYYGDVVTLYDNDDERGESLYVYGFKDGKAVKVEYPWVDYGNGFGTYNGKGALINQEFHHDVGNELITDIFIVENAVITRAKQVKDYTVTAYIDADGYNEPYVYGELPADAEYSTDDIKYDFGILPDDGWAEYMSISDYDGDVTYTWSKVYENGKDVTSKYYDMNTGMPLDDDNWNNPYGAKYSGGIYCVSDASYHTFYNMTAAVDGAQYLREYAKVAGRPSYNFPEVAGILAGDEFTKLADIAANEVNGEVGEIFRISEDLYYVIIYVDGEPAGGAIVKNSMIEDGGYRLVSASDELYTEAELNAAVQKDESVSNIVLNYGEAGKDKAEYLEKAMTQIDGTAVNDAAKSQIVSYVQTAVTEASEVNVKCKGNSAVIDGADVTECLENAQKTRNDMTAALDGVTLNKTVDIIIRVVCRNMDAGETAQITFDPSILDTIGDADRIQVILGDNQHGVSISADALRSLIAQYGQITVQVQKVGEASYSITFIDSEGSRIEQMSESIALTLPAPNEMATVFAEYSGGSDNWGGQFDGVNRTIEFSTPYSGEYEIIDNAADIKDIADLDQQTADAIRFMVSKGYFAVDDENNFNPDGTLNRYMFVEALVRMFFTTDHTLKTSFTDVPADSPYYTYVASGEKDNIVEGISETKFAGDQEVTREQIIALCARTLADKKGYTYPETPDEYLTFTDADKIGGWARSTTALAVREGLIDRGGELAPKEAVSRDEAALMLYKLFMLLYETSAENAAVSTNAGGGGFPAAPVAGGIIVLLAAACGGVFFMKKKKGAVTAEGAVETAAAVVDGAGAAAEAAADNTAVEAEEPVEPGSDKNSKE